MEAIDLKANLRDKVGKGSARFARKNNLIPAGIRLFLSLIHI